MNFYARCLAFAMSTLAIAIMIMPIYQQTQAIVNKSNAVSDDGRRSPESSIIRSLGDGKGKSGSLKGSDSGFHDVASYTRQLKYGPPDNKGKQTTTTATPPSGGTSTAVSTAPATECIGTSTGSCEDEDGEPGVYVCVRLGKSGKVATKCVDPTFSSMIQDWGDGVCGCCDFDKTVPTTGTCPGACTENDCFDEDEFPGKYMCKAVGKGTMVPTPSPASGTPSPTDDPLALPKNIKNVCVPLEETVEAQLKGAICGCCAFGEDSVDGPQGSVNAGNCPRDTCSDINPPEKCTLEDATIGYRMCKFVGKPGSERLQDVCVSDDESLDVQLKGGWCGCCGTCPPAPTPDEDAPLQLRTRQHASHLTIRDKIDSWKNGRSIREEIDSWKKD